MWRGTPSWRKRGGDFAGRGAGVVGAVGDEENAGQGLSAFAGQDVAEGVAHGGEGALGVESFDPGILGDGGFERAAGGGVCGGGGGAGEFNEALAEGERVDVVVFFEPGQEVEALVFEDEFDQVRPRNGRRGLRGWSGLFEAFGGVEGSLGQGDAGLVGRIEPGIGDAHGGRVVQEHDQEAADAAFDGEGQDRAQQQDGQEQEEQNAQAHEQAAAHRGERGGVAVSPPSQRGGAHDQEHDPGRVQSAVEGQGPAGDAQGVLDPRAQQP